MEILWLQICEIPEIRLSQIFYLNTHDEFNDENLSGGVLYLAIL